MPEAVSVKAAYIEAPEPQALRKSNGLSDRLAYRSNEIPGLLGISKSTWHAYVARGITPPSIGTPSGHTRLFVATTVRHWLALSEQAGHLLTREEYAAGVAAEISEQGRRHNAR